MSRREEGHQAKLTPRERIPMRPLTDEQRELAGRYAKMAFRLGNVAARHRPFIAEQVRDAAIDGLMEAVRLYDATRDVKFSTFAIGRINWRIQDAVEKGARALRIGKVAVPIDDYDVPVSVKQENWFCEEVFAGLRPRDRVMMTCLFVLGMTQDETGEKIGVSNSRISMMLPEILADLRGRSAMKALAS